MIVTKDVAERQEMRSLTGTEHSKNGLRCATDACEPKLYFEKPIFFPSYTLEHQIETHLLDNKPVASTTRRQLLLNNGSEVERDGKKVGSLVNRSLAHVPWL
jgi:hypothetical protein